MSPEPSDVLERERKVFALLAEVCELDPEMRERALEAEPSPPAFQLAQSYLRLVNAELEVADRAAAKRHLEKALALLEGLPGKRARKLRSSAVDAVARLRLAAGDLKGAEQAFLDALEELDARLARLGADR